MSDSISLTDVLSGVDSTPQGNGAANRVGNNGNGNGGGNGNGNQGRGRAVGRGGTNPAVIVDLSSATGRPDRAARTGATGTAPLPETPPPSFARPVDNLNSALTNAVADVVAPRSDAASTANPGGVASIVAGIPGLNIGERPATPSILDNRDDGPAQFSILDDDDDANAFRPTPGIGGADDGPPRISILDRDDDDNAFAPPARIGGADEGPARISILDRDDDATAFRPPPGIGGADERPAPISILDRDDDATAFRPPPGIGGADDDFPPTISIPDREEPAALAAIGEEEAGEEFLAGNAIGDSAEDERGELLRAELSIAGANGSVVVDSPLGAAGDRILVRDGADDIIATQRNDALRTDLSINRGENVVVSAFVPVTDLAADEATTPATANAPDTNAVPELPEEAAAAEDDNAAAEPGLTQPGPAQPAETAQITGVAAVEEEQAAPAVPAQLAAEAETATAPAEPVVVPEPTPDTPPVAATEPTAGPAQPAAAAPAQAPGIEPTAEVAAVTTTDETGAPNPTTAAGQETLEAGAVAAFEVQQAESRTTEPATGSVVDLFIR